MFFFCAPKLQYNLVQELAEAPAPLTIIFTSAISFPTISMALSKAAALIIAVPCWSSCITGMFISAFNRSSMIKQSGAEMSSKLMPPKVGSRILTVLINSSTSFVSNSKSKTSISAYILNKSPLPSITGFPAAGPISPKPKTAVPLEMTATKLPLAVYL